MARYIDKDQVIEWIKQRLLPTVTNGNYDDWEKGADNERINFLSFINSLPEKPASKDLDFLVISLEETIGTSPHSREVIKEHLQRAAEWGRNHFEDKSEMVSEDLEEASTKWNETASFQPFYMQLDCNGNPCEVKQDITTHKESFKAGAEWNKQQIIKDAVDATILDVDAQTVELGLWPEKLLDIKEGDRIKIIIVKENG